MATIQFQGICTHFKSSTTPQLKDINVGHRVVLVNATLPTTIAGINIPSHIPSIQIDDGPVIQLQGVHLTIVPGDVGPVPALEYQPNPDTITPSLRAEMSMLETLPPPSFELLFNQPWPAIAAYVDFNFGVLVASFDSENAAMATLNFPSAIITAVPFPNSTAPAPFDGPRSISPASNVVIKNRSNDETMSRGHFFLHYTLGVAVPSAPQVAMNTGPDLPTVGSGCSDSNYP